MKVGAVVLHYQFWPGVSCTLDALMSQSLKLQELIVVDNHSEDGSAEMLSDAYPMLEVFRTDSNIGYGPGMNAGIERLLDRGIDKVLLLTQECVLAPDALELLVLRMEETPEVGALGPLLGYRSRTDMVWSAGGVINRRSWRPTHLGTREPINDWTGKPPHKVEWLDGACILVKDIALRQTGLFDNRFFLYFEEAELLLRLARQGWRVECVPAAVGWQEPGNMPHYLEVRNRLAFIAATAPRRYLVRELMRVVYHLVRASLPVPPPREDKTPRVWLEGLRDFLLRRWGPEK